MARFLNTAAAAKYLETEWGGPAALSVSTLEKARVSGGGPAFVKFGHRVGYRVEDLDEWARERGRLKRSTADAGSSVVAA